MIKVQSKYRTLAAIALCILATVPAVKADTLTLPQAIELAMDNNYNVQIAEKTLEIAELRNVIGEAGFLPSANINIRGDRSISDIRQEFYDETSREINNATSTSGLGNISANWTVFDGFRMFAVKNQLEQLEKQGEFGLLATLENTVAEVASTYYNIVQLQQSVSVLESNLQISRERREIAEARKRIGAGSELEYLTAVTDFTADSMLLINSKMAVTNLKSDLNQLMGRAPDMEYETVKEIPFVPEIEQQELHDKMLEKNPSLLLARSESIISRLQIEEEKAQRYPNLSLFGGYQFSESRSEAGLLRFNRATGPLYGITLSYSLFNGRQVSRDIKQAQLEAETNEIRYQQQSHQLSTLFYKTYNNYIIARDQYQVEQQNTEHIQKNISVALEAFRVGNISNLELREIQQQLLEAESRLIQAKYQVKSNEILLLQLSGELL